MNNTVGAFFNESFVEKKKFVTLKNSAYDSLENTKTCFSTKKKNRWNTNALHFNCTQTSTENPIFMSYGTTSLLKIKIKKDFAFLYYI